MQIKIDVPKAFIEIFKPFRYKVYYGGRGGGKSHVIARYLLISGMKEKMRFLCARELQGSIQDSVHKLLSDIILSDEGLQKFYTVQKTTIVGLNGSEFLFKGLKHNITEIKSTEGVDKCWVEEAERVSSSSWEILLPTIRKDGSEIIVSFNTKNTNDPTYERFVKNADDTMLVRKVSWRDNPFFPDVLNNERLKLQKIDSVAYDHIWEGEPDMRRNGAVYVKQMNLAREEGRITRVPYDPSCEVFTAWDLGFGDATAIWWLQYVGRELRWIEYYENAGEQLQHYVDIVKGKKYNYSNIMADLPHDGGHGNIRGESVSIQLNKLGVKNRVLTREQDINAGIELLRQTLQFSVFDAELCKEGVKALESYHYEWDDNRQSFKKSPLHDWASNGADAARYAARSASMRKGGLIKKTDPFSTNNSRAGWMG